MNRLTKIKVSGKLLSQFRAAEAIAAKHDLSAREKLIYNIGIMQIAIAQTNITTKNYAALQAALTDAEKELSTLSKKDPYFKQTLAELTQQSLTIPISKLLKAFAQSIAALPKKNQMLSA
jgi:hypothetical protein